MTNVDRKLARQSCVPMHSGGRHRPIIIELLPPGELIGFRLKGMRTTYYLPVKTCYLEALKARMATLRAERKAARALKRKASK